MIELSARFERWPVAGAFVIARGAKTHVDVVVVEARSGDHVGRGEGTPIYYHGETAESCVAQISALPPEVDRAQVQRLLPRGAARNAVDCALWDLEARQSGVPVWQLAGLLPPVALDTAMTVSLAAPDVMEADARVKAQAVSILKLKLAGEGDHARVSAVRRGAPDARIIVDANEAWTGRDVVAETLALAELGVEMVEQPVRAGEDHLLDGVRHALPLFADESCQDRSDLPRLVGRYDGINIKLDKCGGLTEALALRAEARSLELQVMVGCMLSTSLGITPAWLVAQGADWVDLDGPLLLERDRPARFLLRAGKIGPEG